MYFQFHPGYTFQLGWPKLNRVGQYPLVVNIVVNYCCTQKMLKETETEETITGFFVTFLSLVAFQLGGAGLLPLPLPHLATPMLASIMFVLGL